MALDATLPIKETSTTRTVIAGLSLVWYLILWSISLLGWRVARTRYSRRPRSPLSSASPSDVPGVSILRPLKGLDCNLFENLESTCLQHYPKFEVLFCVAEQTDQALTVVEELLQKYPEVDAKIIVGEEVVGPNPKVNNLMRAYKTAKYDILWVLDSNVLVDPGTLARAVDALQTAPKPGRRPIGLVHHLPFARVRERSFGSQVEGAFLNTNHAKMYIALNILAFDSCVTGKSSMYRRSDIERVNADLKAKPLPPLDEPARVVGSRSGYGMAAFGKFMAEDNMIGMAIWHELGLRHDLSCDIAENAIGRMSFMDYVWRRVRWIRVRKKMVLAATVLEPFTESIVAGTLAAWAVHYFLALPMWLFLFAHFCFWFVMDLGIQTALAGHPIPRSEQWQFFLAWWTRELCALPIWAVAIVGSTVVWRGRTYKILANGEAMKADENTTRKGRRDHYEPLSQGP